jgi:hypothetical protein
MPQLRMLRRKAWHFQIASDGYAGATRASCEKLKPSYSAIARVAPVHAQVVFYRAVALDQAAFSWKRFPWD